MLNLTAKNQKIKVNEKGRADLLALFSCLKNGLQHARHSFKFISNSVVTIMFRLLLFSFAVVVLAFFYSQPPPPPPPQLPKCR